MNKKQIPLPYQIILTKLWCYSFNGEIDTVKLRRSLALYCRIPKNYITPIINDMQKNKWIEVINYARAKILINPNLDIMYKHKNQMGRIQLN